MIIIAPLITKCLFPGNVNDDCILCPDANKWLNPKDGLCIAACPVKFFEHPLMNQCRDCDVTCNTCSGILPNNCLSCIGNLFLNTFKNTCVTNCVAEGLTKSINFKNQCAICK